MAFKPMLAPNNSPADTPTFFQDIQFPVLASPKLDGIRCVMMYDKARSRTLKLLPSSQVQDLAEDLPMLDGELIIGNPSDFDVYNRTQSHVMSLDKEGDLHYYVFDVADESMKDEPFYKRLELAKNLVTIINRPNVHFVKHTECECLDDLLQFEAECLLEGYEGIMFRSPVGRYKHNRATYKENLIYKLKRFTDDEAIVLDIEEGTLNQNEQKRDERGYSERSTAKAGLVPSGMAGNFVLWYKATRIDVSMGNFNHAERKWVLENKEILKGKMLKFRFFGHGIKDLPRFPRALGFRDEMDM